MMTAEKKDGTPTPEGKASGKASIRWTKEQEKVISLRGSSILVSAAAGSGKTAVLVQRILSRLTDPLHPSSIDRMLIMTFTRAAAGEMKDRIQRAVEQALIEEPWNAHLQKQLTLIPMAQITTIDGFCGFILRNYFHLIGLDPGYRVGEEGEMALMKQDVLLEVDEEFHKEGSPEFLHMLECFCSGRTDDSIREDILRIYDKAMSNPDPEGWLCGCLAGFEAKTPEELKSLPWMKGLFRIVRAELTAAGEEMQQAAEICRRSGGPYHYEDGVSECLDYIENLDRLAGNEDYEGISEFLADNKFPELSRKRPKDVDENLKKAVSEHRKNARGIVVGLKADYFSNTVEETLQLLRISRESVEVLIRMVRRFMEVFSKKKRENNLLDFTDMEHLTLKILSQGEKEPIKEGNYTAGEPDSEQEAAADSVHGEISGVKPPDSTKGKISGVKPPDSTKGKISGAKSADSTRGVINGSAAARELSLRFDEVMIDEYQDSNLVQEQIASYVSGWVEKKNNLFMVGDVKQSIYRFRLARPGLFMDKYYRFSKEGGPEIRIDLHKNFRSRPEVLTAVNTLFRRIMGSDLGGISYGTEEALYAGAEYPEGQDPDFVRPELILINKDDSLAGDAENSLAGNAGNSLPGDAGNSLGGNAGNSLSGDAGEEDGPDEEAGASFAAHEREAMVVAARIQEMVGKEKIYDREAGGFRPLRYGDISILLRSFSGWSEPFTEVLVSRGIPVYAVSRSGYFSATEVVTILNYLKLCDNPRQDIPLAGVLRSPICGCTDEELALIRTETKRGLLYDSVKEFLMVSGNPVSLREKLQTFLEQLTHFRERAVYLPVHQLIREILRETGYGIMVKAMPGGERRSANLGMLEQKAMEYAKTSYHGLFHFIRYIENLHKYEVDYGEVNLPGAGEGAVQLMTVHKSKGLEFPVVFVSGLGKQFNFMDANAQVLVDADLGIAPDTVLPERSLRVPSLKKRLTRDHIVSENIGEELRVLYVAMTRAKEKLIMTGEIGELDKWQQVLLESAKRTEELLPLRRRIHAKSWLDFILPALSKDSCMEPVYKAMGIFPENSIFSGNDSSCENDSSSGNDFFNGNDSSSGSRSLSRDNPSGFEVKLVDALELVTAEASSQVSSLLALRRLQNTDPEQIICPEIREAVNERFSWKYPYESLQGIPVKMTVTELKKRSYHEDEELESVQKSEETVLPMVPRFLREEEEEKLQGNERGTAYHRLMECLDYSRISSGEELESQLLRLTEEKKMSAAQASCIRIKDILIFLGSELGQRMAAASHAGTLAREQPFMISRKASDIDPSWDSSEMVLVQGIIDAYFFEDEEIVLVDYKTDRAFGKDGEMKLKELYRVQLEDYAEALTRLTGRRVKELYIWSFALGKAIQVQGREEKEKAGSHRE